MKIEISKLQPHPLNYRIYGYDDNTELLEKIKQSGYIKPIIVTVNNTILSGHRRVDCCHKLGITEIECEVVDLEYTQQLEIMLWENSYRVKSNHQLLKESEIYYEIEKKKSHQRMMSGVTPDTGSTQGRTTEIVSKKIGMGETTYKKGRKVMEYVEDHPEHEWIVINTMNESVEKSFEMTKKPPEFIQKVIERVGGDKNMVIPIIRELEKERLNSQTPLPPGKFSVIYTDLTRKSIEPLHQTNLSDICDTDCILFLFLRPEQLKDGLRVSEQHWGFKYKTCLVWNKDVLNEVSEEGELLLVSTKGNPTMKFKESKGSVEKPEMVKDLIKNGYKTSVVELFIGDGWEIW